VFFPLEAAVTAPPADDVVVLAQHALDVFAARNDRTAFWINVYNDLIRRALAHWKPSSSVWDVPRFFERAACRVNDFVLSADDVEHGVLRGNRPNPLASTPPFDATDRRLSLVERLDPRIHFALNCGARSCPLVRGFVAETLDVDLDDATRSFLEDTVRLERGAVRIPEIFRWFALDFSEAPGGVAGFLVRHLPDEATRREIIEGGLTIVDFTPWDWRVPP
jgi:uncharacterized protein DUF547